MKLVIQVLLLLSFFASSCFADAVHHDELTTEQLGAVHFPVSCSAGVQKPFEHGVALLHSFWYEQAESTFQKIAKEDPHCAMAHWGVAMSLWHELWNHPDAATIQKGKEETAAANAFHPGTDREGDYIAAITAFYSGPADRKYESRAVAYSKAMRKVYERNSNDHDAGAFYALSLLASERDSDPENRKQAAAILEKLLVEEPNHPGVVHYLIHTYDTADMAQLGLPAARHYAQIAPAVPHALHMPSHIFARLGLWPDDINSNLASIAASRKFAAMGDEGHQFHAMDFLFYAYLQSGHEAEAHRLIEEVAAMPAMKDMYGMGFDPHISSLVAFRAMYPLELHRWKEAAALTTVPGASDEDNSMTHWARAIGLARSGNIKEAQKEVDEIMSIRKKLAKEQKPKWILNAIARDRKEGEAWVEYAAGKKEDAIRKLRSIGDTGAYQASDQVPAREMLADMLLEMNRPGEALREYEADLKINPNRFDSLYGAATAAESSGNLQEADAYYAQIVKVCDGSNSDRPELAAAKLWLARKHDVTARR